MTVDEVNRTIRTAVRLRGGHPRTASDSPTEAHRSHQAAHRTARHAVALAAQLPPDLARAIDLLVVVPDALNLPAPLVVAVDPCAPSRGICVAGLVPEVRRRGNRHDGADRLDPVGVAMVIDELHHHLGRRSSSACAKYADALRKISFMRFNSRTSRSNSFVRWRSAVVRPPRSPVSRSACRTHFRSVSAVHPSLPAIDSIAAPLGRVLSPVLADQPHRSLSYFGGIPTQS